MLEITLITERYKKEENKKTVYKLVSEKTETIDMRVYNNITSDDTIKYFRRLGGTETIQKRNTCIGHVITKLTSTPPDKQSKIVRNFKLEYK